MVWLHGQPHVQRHWQQSAFGGLDAHTVSLGVTFNGGDGNDTFLGGSGDDTTNGGMGLDSLSGNDGNPPSADSPMATATTNCSAAQAATPSPVTREPIPSAAETTTIH